MQTPKHQWSNLENIEQATKLKQQGNKSFCFKQYRQALKCYHKAILHLAGIVDKTSIAAAYSKNVASQNISNQANQLKFSIYLNMSQIYIFDGKYEKGIQILSKAQGIKSNAKLHYRLGICNMKLSQFSRAKQDFQKALDLDPSSKMQIDKLMIDLKQQQKKQNEKSKNMFQKFFK